MKRRYLYDIAMVIVLAAVYFAAAKLGLQLAFEHRSATAVWPPTGLALAAMLLVGYRLWPGVLLGAFAANLSLHSDVPSTIGIAVGNTLEAVIGAWLINRFAGGALFFLSASNVFRSLGLAAIATAISPSFGVTSLAWTGLATWESYGDIWLTWWLGDLGSALLIAPMLVIWFRAPLTAIGSWRIIEAAAMFLMIAAVGAVIFGPLLGTAGLPLAFLCLPPLLWPAFRLGHRGAVSASFLISTIGLVGTLQGFGPFAEVETNRALILLQAFVAAMTVPVLVLAAVVHREKLNEQARTLANQQLASYRDHLERLVDERTRELELSHRRLRLSERMAAMGTLSAGIGHDMGNLLLPIRSRLDAMSSLELPSTAREHVTALNECVGYLNSLTRGLRLFAQDPDRSSADETVDLSAWQADVGSLYKGVLPRQVTLTIDIPRCLPHVAVSQAAITQAVLNLINNAKEAIGPDQPGNVTMRADVADGGQYVCLSVEDDGPGMAEEVRNRAFDPFFTTKTRRLSTGLGLSLVHGIVTGVGGRVEIESPRAQGRGTAVVMFLPAAPNAVVSAAVAAPFEAAISISDARLRALLANILRNLDCTVRMVNGDPGQSTLWVTDQGVDRLATAKDFLGRRRGRTVIVLGQSDPAWALPGAHFIDANLKLSLLQRALRRIVDETAECHREGAGVSPGASSAGAA